MKKSIIFLIISLLASVFLQAQETEKAWQYLNKRNEVCIKFLKKDFSPKLQKILISADYTPNSSFIFAYANKKQFQQFELLNIDYQVVIPPSLQHIPRMMTAKKGSANWDSYPTYPQYVATMQQFANDYPDICSLVKIGDTPKGKEILCLKISDNVQQKEAEPEFLYTSSMHGDELVGYVLMLRLIDYLLSNYNADARVKELLDGIEIYINPLANPDGTYANSDESVAGATRSNSNGVDLNRNFPDPADGLHPDGRDWQAETIAMMDFMTAHNFVLSANFHGGAEVLNYPWDTWYPESHTHADDAWYQYISRQYADTVHINSSSYMLNFDGGITNGADWYSINGGRQDYVNFYAHGREVTIELSRTKLPNAADLPTFWNYNYRSFLNYMQQCLYGVRGTITDAGTGLPLKAKISIQAHDKDSSEVYSEAENGNYHRMILAGTYDITFSKSGYYDKTINAVQVLNKQATELNIQLQPRSSAVEELPNFNLQIFPNPVGDSFELNFPFQELYSVNIFDIRGRKIPASLFQLSEKERKVIIYCNNLPVGSYICRVATKTGIFSQQFIKK